MLIYECFPLKNILYLINWFIKQSKLTYSIISSLYRWKNDHLVKLSWRDCFLVGYELNRFMSLFCSLKRAFTSQASIKVFTQDRCTHKPLHSPDWRQHPFKTDWCLQESRKKKKKKKKKKACILIYRYSICKSGLIHTWWHCRLSFSVAHQQRHCHRLLTETVILARSPPETAISNTLWPH